VPLVNALGYVAAEAAYRHCSEWRADLLDYLRQNRDTVANAIGQMPLLSMTPVEATYLAWIDVRSVKLHNPVKFFEDAGVGLQDGIEFEGSGFVRLNFGCRRALLEEALKRMSDAVERQLTNRP
jgi:cystathionine beta-lyase